MYGPKSYGRYAPKPRPEKRESRAEYEERTVREEREQAELVKNIQRAHGITNKPKE